MWSDTYDGELDDIFAIQQRIGGASPARCKRKLVFSNAKAARPVNGEAYALYLNARGVLRSGIPAGGQEDAVGMLQRAIKIDPSFAPAWASLGARVAAGRPRPGQ